MNEREISQAYIENDIHPSAVINWPKVKIGKGNKIGPHCSLGFPGAIRNCDDFKGGLVIGNNNTFGSSVVACIGSEAQTSIGNGNIIMNLVNIGHNAIIGNNCEIGAGTIIAGFVMIGNGVRVKIGARVRNRVHIVDNAVIGMGANVTKSISEKGLYIGNPAKIKL